MPNEIKHILKNIIDGIVITGQADTLATTRNFLCASFTTSTTVKRNYEEQSSIKKEQTQKLISFCTLHHLFVDDIVDESLYLAEGGEATVYFGTDNKSVIKFNDGVYYFTWLDFLNSIIIHNTLFPETNYTLLGFSIKNDNLFAVLKQPFVISNQKTELDEVKSFLAFNGFKNTRGNDYYHQEWGLILEDMHDENIIVNSNALFFIDTVFFIDLK